MTATDLRIDADSGVPSCDGVTFATTGERVLLLAAPHALFLGATGLAPVIRGALAVRGIPAADAALRVTIAGAAMDPPLPPRWTVLEYLTWSARLSGVPHVEAGPSAARAIERLKLGPMGKTPLAKLVPHARRATVVGAALATYAEVIALDDPLGGLPDEVADAYGSVLVEALDDRAWIVFAPRMPLASPLGAAADEALVFGHGGEVDAQGVPRVIAGASRRFVGRTLGSIEGLAASLESRGARLETKGAHVLFDLGATLSTGELVAMCAAADVTVVELLPAVRALT